jgi:RNA polymerase sigma-70 factor (ECF subfamily)
MSQGSTTSFLLACLQRLQQGDPAARDELLTLACDRLRHLAQRMLQRYPRLRQWEQTDDVLQNSLLRLRRSLAEVVPGSPREFFGLAAEQIRRELLDLTRHYYGRHRHTDERDAAAAPRVPVHFGLIAPQGDEPQRHTPEAPDDTYDPAALGMWTEFHRRVDELPDAEREVVHLLFYQELTQVEAAEVLAVDPSTVKRRWRSARLRLCDALEGLLPEAE